MNLYEILTSLELGLIYGIVAIGIYFTFRIIDFPDLTCDGSFMTGSAVCAITIQSGCPPFLAWIFGALAGSLCGLITGTLNIYGKITNLLCGILTTFMLYSINLRIMGGVPNISIISIETLSSLILITIIIWFISSYILRTDFGLGLQSIGSNPRLASISGVSIAKYTIIGLMLSNGFIGLGGALFCQHQGFCDISQGIGTVVIGLAGVIIGEKLIPQKSIWLNILTCLMGSILYRFVIAISLHSSWLGLKTSDMNMITGLILIILMIFSKNKRSIIC